MDTDSLMIGIILGVLFCMAAINFSESGGLKEVAKLSTSYNCGSILSTGDLSTVICEPHTLREYEYAMDAYNGTNASKVK
jgi:hypothetical protein